MSNSYLVYGEASYVSQDLTVWQSLTFPFATQPAVLRYLHGLWLAGSGDIGPHGIYVSTDGKNWTQVLTSGTVREIVWTGTRFIAVGESLGGSAMIAVSADGRTWTPITTAIDDGSGLVSVDGTGSTWVATYFATNRLAVTTDGGLTWAYATLPISPSSTGRDGIVAYGPAGWVVTSSRLHSSDAVTWTQFTTPGGSGTSVAVLDGVYVMALTVSSISGFATSTDGVIWGSFTAGPLLNFANHEINGLLFGIAFTGSSNLLYTSSDGLTWTLRLTATAPIFSVAYGPYGVSRLRQSPRDDYLGGAPRQGRSGGSTSKQSSARQGWVNTYR